MWSRSIFFFSNTFLRPPYLYHCQSEELVLRLAPRLKLKTWKKGHSSSIGQHPQLCAQSPGYPSNSLPTPFLNWKKKDPKRGLRSKQNEEIVRKRKLFSYSHHLQIKLIQLSKHKFPIGPQVKIGRPEERFLYKLKQVVEDSLHPQL